MGHCNFEFIPKWIFTIFPPLKYIVYTPSFHSLHHTKFRTNYSLFCPFYDYAYGTVDVSTDTVYETALKGAEESPDVVVDGRSLAAAIVLNTIPKEQFSSEAEFQRMSCLGPSFMSKGYQGMVGGDGLTDKEQSKAPKGTIFIPFRSPTEESPKDCYYHTTPPWWLLHLLKNMNSCEDWLTIRAMSASRVAGIIHASEGFDVNECGGTIFSIYKVWEVSLENGFPSLPIPS
ncbi:Detected protein of confused Function [Hibiscus syriacus]|uniref:Detected protein of confused Function n=1 Tax=Hibiscus syriacus TaxID=106335 RepID=A0A6A3B834_HIBSY|nr:Detected protein of confused Function [Hibiscus syriacus]